jgi:amino acid adenylation domain-containing protein
MQVLSPRSHTGPLAFQQERLWFLHRLDPLSSAYNMPYTVRIVGRLRPDAVQAALDAAVRSHDVLRSRFPMVGGSPVQVVEREMDVPLQVADLTELPRERRADEAARMTREQAARPFDLARGGLLRALLLRLDQDEHRLVLVLHHIITDGAATPLLLREIVEVYGSVVRGAPAAIPKPTTQYSDYVAWQRDPLRQGTLERQLAHWQSRLSNAPGWIDLPADRPPRTTPSLAGSSRSLSFSAQTAAALRAAARSEHTTLFVFLLATLQVLLHRYSGQSDIIVAIPVSDRRHAAFERLIGYLGNTVLIRGEVTGELRFRDLLRMTQNELLDALDNQDVPFERVVEALRPRRSAGNPIFQVMLAFDEADRPPVLETEDSLQILPLEEEERQDAIADLSLCITAHPDDIDGYVEFARDRFDPATIERLIGHFRTLLSAAIADTGIRVADLPLLTANEQRQIRIWSQGPAPFPDTNGMHRLFEAQARLTPDRPALIAGRRQVTYRALDRSANRVAHELVTLGAGPGSFVGVQATRSPQTVAALLGVLKTGAAYVALDPELGEQRIRFALRDLPVLAVVADAPPPGAPTALSIVKPPAGLGGRGPGPSGSHDPPRVEVCGDDLAYAIYTSGSTGAPKAVGISHGSAACFLHWSATRFTADELSGVLASTSPVFDCALFEIFAPLSWGGTVVLARSALELPTLPARDRVRLVSAAPATMEELLRQGGLPSGVTTVNLVGDVVPDRLVGALNGTARRTIYNHYGPSEATTYVTGASVAAGSAAGWDTRIRDAEHPAPNIGRPITGARVYVADAYLNLLPVGVPGELFIGGAALARGYIGQPGLTAERFVPDRWSGQPGARVYRTGDVGKYRSDGSLDFLGRRDRQLKIRGFRVEPAEVESVLNSHPHVQRSVVVGRDQPDGERLLIAYYVSAGTGAPDPAELTTYLRSRLPSAMVPASVVLMGSLPLTDNGKIDHKALPPAGRPVGAAHQQPRTMHESALAQIWMNVLGRTGMGVTDDFFDLGGNSLRMVALAYRIEEAFGVQLSLSDLLGAPTIRDQAALVRAALSAVLPKTEG